MSLTCVADVVAQLDRGAVASAAPLWLQVGPYRLKLLCEGPLREELRVYFHEALGREGLADVVVEVLDGQALTADVPPWVEWAREPGKTGRKDAIHALSDGRLVHKLRTGVTFLQSEAAVIAFGPCAQHPNQVVNFVNTQILNMAQRQGWQMCHAAAVTDGARTLAIAGLSGGGKSTSVLRMMDLPALSFVTNDRLLVRAATPFPEALGIPKEPRINPGTILHNARLHPMLGAERLAALRAMPQAQLWHLEEKYDLIVREIYGSGRVRYGAPLTDFWVLNWQRDTPEATRIEQVDLAQRPDLLGAIMKSPGPFYQGADGVFLSNHGGPVAADYLSALAGVRVCEVSGRVDFDALMQAGGDLFGGGAVG